jgi:hypothetical protein
MPVTPWATIVDVTSLTGKTVTQEQRNQAAATIELHCGAIEAVERPDVSERDRYWLKLAVSYQAAWLAAQPDLFERNDVSSAGQDGESASFRPDAHTLAPLARKAHKRLSWRGPRTLNPPRADARGRRLDTTSEEYDDSLAWKRM